MEIIFHVNESYFLGSARYAVYTTEVMKYIQDYTFAVFLVIILPFYLVNGLQGRICKVSGIIKCCENFYNKNGVCEECPIGFETNDGKKCVPCTTGFYGHRFTSGCNCKKPKTCNHVSGMCIVATKEQNTEEDNCKPDAVFFGCLLAAFIAGGGLSLLLERLWRKCIQQLITYTDADNQRSSDHVYFVHSGYNYIDESQMVDMSSKSSRSIPHYENGSDINSLATQLKTKFKTYPNPYQPLESVTSSSHRYSHLRGSKKDESLSDSWYLNPYTPLNVTGRDSHEYKKCLNNKESIYVETDNGETVSQTIV